MMMMIAMLVMMIAMMKIVMIVNDYDDDNEHSLSLTCFFHSLCKVFAASSCCSFSFSFDCFVP